MKKIRILAACMLMLALLSVSVGAASYTVAQPRRVGIDGVISTQEWGEPLYNRVTLAQAGTVDSTLTAEWFDPTQDGEAAFDLYVSHDEEYVYIGCAVYGVDREISTASPEMGLHFAFTLSEYQESTGVRHAMQKGEEYEVYTGYRLYQTADGRAQAQTISQAIKVQDLRQGRDYAVVYDEASRTMTYEAAVALKNTNISLEKNAVMAFSAVIGLEHYNNRVSGQVDGSNRFLIGTGAADGGGAKNWAHKDGCLPIGLVPLEKIPMLIEEDEGAVTAYAQDVDIPIASEPEYKIITADAPVSVPLMIMLISVAVALICAAAVTVMLVRERNRQRTNRQEEEK